MVRMQRTMMTRSLRSFERLTEDIQHKVHLEQEARIDVLIGR